MKQDSIGKVLKDNSEPAKRHVNTSSGSHESFLAFTRGLASPSQFTESSRVASPPHSQQRSWWPGRQRWDSSCALCGPLSPLNGNPVRGGTFRLTALVPRATPCGLHLLASPLPAEPHTTYSDLQNSREGRRRGSQWRSSGLLVRQQRLLESLSCIR